MGGGAGEGREGGLSVQRWAVHVRGFAHNGA